MPRSAPTQAAPVPSRSDAESAAVVRFKRLTEELLPARARAERWPIRLDHCFKRICLDFACGEVWYHRLARPAERHLSGPLLARALRCAEELLAGNATLLHERDALSLQFRGKQPKRLP